MLPWFFAFTTLFFATLAAYFSWRLENKIEQVDDDKRERQRDAFEKELLKSITDKVGYSLNIETVSETLALTIENLFDLTSVSYALIGQDKTITVKTIFKEKVAEEYSRKVCETIDKALISIDPKIAGYQVIDHSIENDNKSYIDPLFDTVPQSYFNVPLVIDNELVGMINISSKKKGVYQDADMSLVYKIVNTAQITIERLNEVIETEKGKLDSLIKGLPSGTLMFSIVDGHFELTVVNDAARDFLSLPDKSTMADVLSKLPKEFSVADNIKSVFEAKEAMSFEDVKIGERNFTIYLNPVFLHNSLKIIGVAMVLRDMSLENKIEKIRTDFTSMIVHELRAPVTAIRGAASLIRSESLPKPEEEKMLSVISDAANNMLSTISELLDVASIEEGKLAIRKEKGDVVSMIKHHMEVFSYAAREKDITIDVEAQDGIPSFYFDPERLGQVINNLVSNAIKFTRNGGKIEVKIWREDQNLEVMVSDNGMGIPSDKKAFLFTKFGRIKQGSVAPELSSGLGLFITKQIVEAHGGKIWLESEQNVGTKIYFSIPLSVEEDKSDSSFIFSN